MTELCNGDGVIIFSSYDSDWGTDCEPCPSCDDCQGVSMSDVPESFRTDVFKLKKKALIHACEEILGFEFVDALLHSDIHLPRIIDMAAKRAFIDNHNDDYTNIIRLAIKMLMIIVGFSLRINNGTHC